MVVLDGTPRELKGGFVVCGGSARLRVKKMSKQEIEKIYAILRDACTIGRPH